MQYANLGRAGVKVSRICLGCFSYGSRAHLKWVLEEEECRPLFRKALDLGINFFDTADEYCLGASEEITGRALLDYAARDQVVIATKVFFPVGPGPNDRGLSRVHIMNSIDASLCRLGTDHVDIYYIHRFDAATPVEETMEALHDVVKSGKARYLGASAMATWQFATMQFAAERHGWTRFAAMQNHYNLIYREEEREMIPFCIDDGVGLVPWSPLARGLLARQPDDGEAAHTRRARLDPVIANRYTHPGDGAIIARVAEVAARRGVPMARIALAWMLGRPWIASPIIGASKPGHIDDAVAALDILLDDDEAAFLEALYEPRAVTGFDPAGRQAAS